MEATGIEKAKMRQKVHKRAEDIRTNWTLFCLFGIPTLTVYPLLVAWSWIRRRK